MKLDGTKLCHWLRVQIYPTVPRPIVLDRFQKSGKVVAINEEMQWLVLIPYFLEVKGCIRKLKGFTNA